jgi:hypothetical protein
VLQLRLHLCDHLLRRAPNSAQQRGEAQRLRGLHRLRVCFDVWTTHGMAWQQKQASAMARVARGSQ